MTRYQAAVPNRRNSAIQAKQVRFLESSRRCAVVEASLREVDFLVGKSHGRVVKVSPRIRLVYVQETCHGVGDARERCALPAVLVVVGVLAAAPNNSAPSSVRVGFLRMSLRTRPSLPPVALVTIEYDRGIRQRLDRPEVAGEDRY